MYQLLSFIGYLASMGIMGAGVLYCVNKEKFIELSQNISWETVKCYHKVSNKLRNAVNEFEKQNLHDKKTKKTNIKLKNSYNFYGSMIHTDNEFSCSLDDIDSKKYFIDDTDFDIMFVKKTDFEGQKMWKRILNKEELNDLDELKNQIIKVEKPFLQIEYCLKSEDLENKPLQKTEIHSELNDFYVKNNKILDSDFVEWYLKKFYGTIYSDNYELQLIDSNINIFKLTKDKYCLLENDNNKEYSIVSATE